MSKKKNTPISVSQEENAQAQPVFEQYHQIANDLRASKDQKQAETALTEINTLSENAQMALLKELSKEQQVDAADVLIAINEMSPLKGVRKEARRSLLRLESTKIYPRWEPPIDRTPAISAIQSVANPPRFWKGVISDTRALGMLHLFLIWEQGEDYKEVRMLGFLLEFGHDGVKDFFTMIRKKRDFDDFFADLQADTPDMEWEACSLAQGQRLLQEALDINKKRGTKPYREYNFNISLIKQLILDVPDLEEEAESEEESIDLHGLDPDEVVTNFVAYWVNEDYDTAYDLLSEDSFLREGLSREDWIERRESWAEEAHPDDLDPCFIDEREQQLPPSGFAGLFFAHRPTRPTPRRVIETGWSVRLDKTSLDDDPLPELPQATAVYEETGRHWFWATYILVEEHGEWRIQSIVDESLNAQDLSIEELQSKVGEFEAHLEVVAARHHITDLEQLAEPEILRSLAETYSAVLQSAYYRDILIQKEPLDRSVYETAMAWMALVGQYERSLTYLIPLTRLFSEQRGPWLRRVATIQQLLAAKLSSDDDDEGIERCKELAEEALRESLTEEDSFEAHISLAEILISNDEFDEAEAHLLQAKELLVGTDLEEEEGIHIELRLGEIAMGRKQFEEALSCYQRVVEYQPNVASSWFDVGEAHQALGHLAEAEASYRHAIELAPDNPDYYYALSTVYKESGQPSKELAVLQQGLAANPDSIDSHLFIAQFYIESGDYHQAEIVVSKTERLDPESPDIHSLRMMLNVAKSQQKQQAKKFIAPPKQKKKR
jgi:tetratricopeptide (TPR) repeat protein